uniref:Uncharacterized protein n=1 Tax=Ciona savignyi TaxID=51511 RepID=H2Z5S2_CIOSA
RVFTLQNFVLALSWCDLIIVRVIYLSRFPFKGIIQFEFADEQVDSRGYFDWFVDDNDRKCGCLESPPN